MIMYKAAVIFSNYWFDYSIFLFYENAPKMIPFILAGVILTLVIIAALLILSSSLKLQVLLVKFANRWFKRPKLRDWVDNCNLQIYSLRAAVQTITQDRSALLRIFSWNVFKLLFWYIIPYIVLVENHPNIDLLLVMSLPVLLLFFQELFRHLLALVHLNLFTYCCLNHWSAMLML